METTTIYRINETDRSINIAQYKAEIKALTEEILEKHGYDPTVVAKMKKGKK